MTGSKNSYEDRCGHTGDTAWLIDGATSVLRTLNLEPGRTDSAWYADTLDTALHDAGDTGIGAAYRLRLALHRIDDYARTLPGNPYARFPSAAVTIVHATTARTRILALADAHAIIETTDGHLHHMHHPLPAPAAGTTAISRRLARNTAADGIWVARREDTAAPSEPRAASCSPPTAPGTPWSPAPRTPHPDRRSTCSPTPKQLNACSPTTPGSPQQPASGTTTPPPPPTCCTRSRPGPRRRQRRGPCGCSEALRRCSAAQSGIKQLCSAVQSRPGDVLRDAMRASVVELDI